MSPNPPVSPSTINQPFPRRSSPLAFPDARISDSPPRILEPANSRTHVSKDDVPPSTPSGPSRSSTTSSETSENQQTSPSTSSTSAPDTLVPLQPLPDSLLLRATFSSLEHSTTTLKRISKAVQASSAVVLNLLDQLEKAEDELYIGLGELGRFLESGYGISGEVWDDQKGLRKVGRERRRREKEELEFMVDHGLKSVRQELKRQGLAGGPAQTRFEQVAKQYYNQTSVYLTPQAAGSSSSAPQSYPLSNSSATSTSVARPTPSSISTSSDLAQASRSAQFDLARYNHHSTLLYAVPPSSVGCLDLLVGLYGWAGCVAGENPTLRDGSGGEMTPVVRQRQMSGVTSLPKPVPPSTTEELKASLSSSLSQLSRTRSNLLEAWKARDRQTAILEEECAQRQAEAEGLSTESSQEPLRPRASPRSPIGGLTEVEVSTIPISALGIEGGKKLKSHKVHRSVGGRLRDMLSSSGSSRSLALDAKSAPVERRNRMSLDGGYDRPSTRVNLPDSVSEEPGGSAPPPPKKKGSMPDMKRGVPFPSSNRSPPPAVPMKDKDDLNKGFRPHLASRHSIQLTGQGEYDYRSPFLPVPGVVYQSPNLQTSSGSRDEIGATLDAVEESPVRLGTMPSRGYGGVGGVGGINGAGDEDERREEVGRKKEGVLWGAGSWEGLSKGGGKGKWEKFWVVLEHSRIYEYRDTGLGKPESAFAVIDLKFASVREGRGTERRFAFEIVTPSQGRRLYQATSDSEMKIWLYAICNAIESCINGTSSVRTFDASKLRTVSGSLDDHALPARTKMGLNLHNNRMIGLGLPIPPPSRQVGNRIQGLGTPNRRSMPPPPKSDMLLVSSAGDPDGLSGLMKRTRKTSFKKALKQSAEAAGEKWSSVVNGVSGQRNTGGGGLDIPRPTFLGQGGLRSSSRSSVSIVTDEGRLTPTSSSQQNQNQSNLSPASSRSKPSNRSSWFEESVDGEIEKRVLEMAGVRRSSSPVLGPSNSNRRVHSEALGRLTAGETSSEGSGMVRSKSAEVASNGNGDSAVDSSKGRSRGDVEKVDMQMLRRIAELPDNSRCADCGKGMKSSRWATLSLRGVPMVIFICIRCCGLHRGLGRHISKPCSVDLDIWSVESIELARKWGNERCNAIWERLRSPGMILSDDEIPGFIKQKYVEGRWLCEEDRVRFGLESGNVQNVGTAL